MSKYDYKYYLCPKCDDYLEPELEHFVCFSCTYEHPRDKESELIDGLGDRDRSPSARLNALHGRIARILNSGLTPDEMREELSQLSQPERYARGHGCDD